MNSFAKKSAYMSLIKVHITISFRARNMSTTSAISSKFIDASYRVSSTTNAFRNVLIVMKQTPFQQYSELKAQGKAPVALRWNRLQSRDEINNRCVESVQNVLNDFDIPYHVVRRDGLHRGLVEGKDLVIAVGGDGTILNTSTFIDDSIPVLGINSDPSSHEDQGVRKVTDERRSRGALCALKSTNLNNLLPRILSGDVTPGLRSRIQCLVRSTYTETRLPPALNDILIAHPSPAAVSRFKLSLCSGNIVPSYSISPPLETLFSLNVWSSGIWISTATGSTAAMASCGGEIMDIRSSQLQYRVREHLVEEGNLSYEREASAGRIQASEMLHLRWNSQVGCLYVDGSHMKHDLELGDEISLDGHAPFLKLFDPIVE